MIRPTLLVAVCAAALSVAPAQAQVCTASATMLAFGSYDPTAAAPTDSIGSVSVVCNGPAATAVSYRIMLANAGAARHLVGNDQAGVYQLYLDAAHTRVWGDCSGGTSCVADGGVLGRSTIRRTYPIFSRMPPHQPLAPGRLSDMVTVTLSY